MSFSILTPLLWGDATTSFHRLGHRSSERWSGRQSQPLLELLEATFDCGCLLFISRRVKGLSVVLLADKAVLKDQRLSRLRRDQRRKKRHNLRFAVGKGRESLLCLQGGQRVGRLPGMWRASHMPLGQEFWTERLEVQWLDGWIKR